MNIFLYPGQGSQKVGMGEGLASTVAGKNAFEKAERILGYDLLDLCLNGPAEQLQQTLHTQPALYVVGSVLTDVLIEEGITPEALGGHSAGEYAALYAAGVLDFETGLHIVKRRAELMNDAGKSAGGAMAAVMGGTPEQAEKLVEEYSGKGILSVAAYNAAGQTVISGEKTLVEQAASRAKDFGARMAKVLPVSGAFHSGLMKEAEEVFKKFLDEFNFSTPRFPIVSNRRGQVEDDPKILKQGLSELLTHPVRWTDCLETLSSYTNPTFYEIGPGNILAGLLKKFDRNLQVRGINNPSNIEK